MVALGLLLVLVALAVGALAAWLAARSTTGVLLEGAGLSVTVLPLTLLALGAALLALLWLGWRLMVAGSRRRRAEREELRQLRTRTKETGGGDIGAGHRSGTTGRQTVAPATKEASAPAAPSPSDRAVQPRAGTSPPSGEGSGSHAGDRPPRS